MAIKGDERGMGAVDPFWVDLEPDAVYAVTMFGSHGIAYQRWLRAQGLFMFAIPGQPPAYAVGSRETGDPVQYPDAPAPSGRVGFSDAIQQVAARSRRGPNDTPEVLLRDLLWLCESESEAAGTSSAQVLLTAEFMERMRAVLHG